MWVIHKNNNEIPHSISMSTYIVGKKQRYWFTTILWLVALLNYFQPMGMYGALASAGLFFTGATIAFKDTGAHQNIVHYIGAGTAIIFSFLGLVFLHNFWYIPLLAGVFMIPFIKSPNWIWWVEIVSIVFVFLTYYFI